MDKNTKKEIDKEIKTAVDLIRNFKGKKYTFGPGCIEATGDYIREFGKNTLLIISRNRWADTLRKKVAELFDKNNIAVQLTVDTAAPNNPSDDVVKLAELIIKSKPAGITCVGGGSAIDCAKAANALASVGKCPEELELFFGTGNISRLAQKRNKTLYPLVAVQVSAGSAAHLTKYSNVTFVKDGQKKLIVDNILIPDRAVFDYSTTTTAPLDLTIDGAMDGMSHALEVYFGADREKIGQKKFDHLEKVCLTAISLIVKTLPLLVNDLKNEKYREKVGIATDLGGYAIMLGGTNGPHLNSFSLTDILSHGRACAILNPYYTVFFSNSIYDKLIRLAGIFRDYIENHKAINDAKSERPGSRKLGELIASAMIGFSKTIGFPFKFSQVIGFSESYIDKIIDAAKNPQLKMKLKNMPVSLDSDLVDRYMRPVLLAAFSGDFSIIKNIGNNQ